MRMAPFRSRDFALLWTAGFISLTGGWLLGAALPIYVYQLTGSPGTTSLMVVLGVVCRLAFGAIAGVYVDRWDRRKVMIWANVAQAVVLLPLALVTSAGWLWLAYAVICVESALSQFVIPAEQALLPRLVDEQHLAAANSLNQLNNNLARLIGPTLGGVVAVTAGLTGVVLLDAAALALAAGLVLLIRGRHRASAAVPELVPVAPAPEGALRRFGRELAEGYAAILRSHVLRVIFVVLAVTSIGEGIMASLFPVFVDRALGGGAAELGGLMSAQAVGGLLGGLLCVWLAPKTTPVRMVGVGLVLFGAIDLVIFNYPRLAMVIWPELALFVLVGIPGAVMLTGLLTLVQTEVGDALRGRVFSVAGVVGSAGALIGAAVAGTLTDLLGVMNVLTAQGLGYVVAGVLFAILVRPRTPAREFAQSYV